MVDYLVDTKENFEDKIIKNPIFLPQPVNNLSLKDTVIVYSDGTKYKIVPLNIMFNYPIIYDQYLDDQNTSTQISVTLCPYTLSTIIYFGTFNVMNKVYNSNIVLNDQNDKDKIIFQMTGNIFSLSTKKLLEETIRKEECKIMILRNAITMFPDSLHLHFDKNIDHTLNTSYLIDKIILYPVYNESDRYHPKTLIYGIEYHSKKKSQLKYSALVTKDSNPDRVNKKNIIKNGVHDYLEKMIDKIREKGGLIINCFWFGWYAMHPDTKVIVMM